MSQALQKQEVNKQDIHPDVLQRRAADPNNSVWVGASAGSGKTKVLTDRILRLLLPDSNGLGATKPHKILALTFTKAGAGEMALRINERLSEWATISLEQKNENDEEIGLVKKLTNLFGSPPTNDQINAARKLFAAVVDTPGGLNIMTIHSFCQSVLGRFPLEADLPPNFKPLEESQAKNLLIKSRDSVLKNPNLDKGSPLTEAIYNLSLTQNEDQLTNVFDNFISERHQAKAILNSNFGTPEGLYTALCQRFSIPAGISIEAALANFCTDKNIDESGLRSCCAVLATGTPKTDQSRGLNIQEWLDAGNKKRITLYKKYKEIFLTNENTIRKDTPTKKLGENNPNIIPIITTEAERILQLENDFNAIKTTTLTRDIFLVGQEILQKYQSLKNQQNALDFDDLILRTLDLLQGKTKPLNGLNVAPWVRFKMDQGIDHILVDEAQDTNPEQWEIIKALCDDFYDSLNEEDAPRTVFIVGDEKQSIFRFQRASPEKFQEMHHWFEEKIKSSQHQLSHVDFITSFRSVKSVLSLVDAVFADEKIRQGLGPDDIEHKSWRSKQPGLVELWPLFESNKQDKTDPWAPPLHVSESSSGAAQLATHIASTVADWINNKQPLESYNRPVEAGDILILVRSRSAFLDQLVKSLKDKNIPVSGVDRMILSEQLVVQDLCAAAEFALLPDDDLNLAGLLKSPFIGWSEEQLFDVAYNRTNSLWHNVKQSTDQQTVQWLKKLIKSGSTEKSYDFFAKILQEACPADEQSGLRAIKKRLGEDCLDPLDEFLNTALSFEQEHIPSLQHFLQNQLHNDSQIKRQMEEAGSAVRIMTVHGAKGLQAPIVILPDTTRNANSIKTKPLLWPDQTQAELPYFCPSTKEIPEPCKEALTFQKERDNEEYRRLLYVALTRAENRLYIAGYKSSKPIIEDSWYNYVTNGFAQLPDVKKIAVGDKEILRYSNSVQNDKPDRADKNKEQNALIKTNPPEWLFKPMPEEPFPPRPLVPSKPSGEDTTALSPLKSQDNYRYLRGNITHKLLQLLPNIDSNKREEAARRYVFQPAHNLSNDVREEIISETMTILEHKDFAPIFGEGSYAEISISGLLNNKTSISGQIDRLLITADEILIVDYKTGKTAKSLPEVPQQYKNQLKAYAEALQEIYPDRSIKTALIWTEGPTLMEIPQNS